MAEIIFSHFYYCFSSMTNLEGKFCNRFQNAYAYRSWLLATCSCMIVLTI